MKRQKRQARRKLHLRLSRSLKPAGLRAGRANLSAFVVSAALLMAGMGALFAFGTSEAFTVQSVVVEGNSLTAAETIAGASETAGRNIFSLHFGEVQHKLQALTSLKEVHAAFDWPNAVRLSVVERQPLFAWESAKRRSWVDDSGVIFTASIVPAGTLTVLDLDNRPRTTVEPSVVAFVKSLSAAMPALKQIEYSDSRGFGFIDGRGWRVLIGQPDQLNVKLSVLNVLAAYLIAQKIDPEYIDLRLPERAFYKAK
ncbi:MAG: FtsQ-type POTRA domain-containing protein [Chloroflexi bacterium]|nr:FtsQ-type POTRA domain-containing protein [Chloroflexota bacterium]MBI3733073.1 FtsQ-type POTRA domain-containing protein [Chloroflexota bacterium]